MQFTKTEQSDHDKVVDRVIASMETGNIGNARTLVAEYSAIDPAKAEEIQFQVVQDYGIRL